MLWAAPPPPIAKSRSGVSMNRITFQFSSSRDPLSALIRWFSHSNYSHVDLVRNDGSLLGARFEGGVAVRPDGYANFNRTLRVTVDSPAARAVYDYAESQVGKPYDWRAIAGFASGRSWMDDDRWFCSELAIASLIRGRFFNCEMPFLRQSKITPGDALLILEPFVSAYAESS